MSDRAVTNTACLIGLGAVGRLDLLARLFEPIIAPPELLAEYGSDPPGVVEQPVTDSRLVQSLRTQVHLGEAAAIALAMESDVDWVILDDKKARRIARQMGLGVTGTLGVLIRAKTAGLLPEVKPVIDELSRLGFRMSPALRDTALRLAGESP